MNAKRGSRQCSGRPKLYLDWRGSSAKAVNDRLRLVDQGIADIQERLLVAMGKLADRIE